MSYTENIDNEISSGKISKKEGLELKTHYYSLDSSDRADLDKRFSINQNSSNSNSTIGGKIKDFFIEDIPDEDTKKNIKLNQSGKKTDKGIFINKSDTADTIFEKYINANDNQKEDFIVLIISLKSYGDPKYDEALEMINKHKRKSSNFFDRFNFYWLFAILSVFLVSINLLGYNIFDFDGEVVFDILTASIAAGLIGGIVALVRYLKKN